jgi:hypothetical protein
MGKIGFCTIVIIFSVGASACSSAPIPPPVQYPTLPPLPSLAPPATATTAATATRAFTATPSASAAVATTIVSATLAAGIQLTPSPTGRPSGSPVPQGTPTASLSGIAPGVYVTELKTDPNPPSRNADLTFIPTFVNAVGAPQNQRWVVYIYKTDSPSRSTGETAPAQTTIPVGTSDQKPGSTWKWGPGNQCDFFVARVGALDQDKRITLYTKPDGKVFEKTLTLCP